eukprot:4302283-Amphidinium_carterae.1
MTGTQPTQESIAYCIEINIKQSNNHAQNLLAMRHVTFVSRYCNECRLESPARLHEASTTFSHGISVCALREEHAPFGIMLSWQNVALTAALKVWISWSGVKCNSTG